MRKYPIYFKSVAEIKILSTLVCNLFADSHPIRIQGQKDKILIRTKNILNYEYKFFFKSLSSQSYTT